MAFRFPAIRKNLYTKLPLYLLMYLVTVTVFYSFGYVRYMTRMRDASDQALNWYLAKHLVSRYQIILDERGFTELAGEIERTVALHPRIAIYILGADGRVKIGFGDTPLTGKPISLAPIKKFLEQSTQDEVPIYGDAQGSIPAVFSVSPFKYGLESGYLYVLLRNDNARMFDTVVGLSFLISGVAIMTISFVPLTIVIGLACFFILTRRIRRLVSGVKDFSAGSFETRIPTEGNDEITLLGSVFNTMAEQIDRSTKELKRKDELRRELIASVSHDLRRPVSIISAFAELLLGKQANIGNEERAHCELIMSNCGSLTQLLNELFELAKFEAKEMSLRYEEFSIDQLVDDIVAGFTPQARSKKITLNRTGPEILPEVWGDIMMIGRVITNLVENALRYTPEGGGISIGLADEGTQIIVSISDTGVGIAEDALPFVFDKFYQVKRNDAHSNGLSGLGLAIVKKIIEAHGSSVSVSSAVGQGTTFSFGITVHHPLQYLNPRTP